MDKMKRPLIKSDFARKHPILVNLAIIIIVAALGIWIVYFSIALFTKHGQTDKVPGVENMTYTQAIEVLHENGFKVDIRDSLYKDDVKPGFVIEQFPKANSIDPKEVVIDDDNHPMEDALRSFSYRSAMAKLQELGFKDIKVVRVLGDNECVAKITANGATVKKMQKVPVNAKIVMQVYDGRLAAITDSLMGEEALANYRAGAYDEYDAGYDYDGGDSYPGESSAGGAIQSGNTPAAPAEEGSEEENIEFF